MAIEQSLLAQAVPFMVEQRIRAILGGEIAKGCSPVVSNDALELEPSYEPFSSLMIRVRDNSPGCVPWQVQTPLSPDRLVRARVWLSPEQPFDWKRSELWLKQLSGLHYRMSWEILGNSEDIAMYVMCGQEDLPVVQAAFQGQFERCLLSPVREHPLQKARVSEWGRVVFCDYYPSPPYSHLLTRPEELARSPYFTLMTALRQIPEPALGFYQVLLEPTAPECDWHQNVNTLMDIEYSRKAQGTIANPARNAQQVPSGDLRQMALETETKAHNDKPFFAVALRIGLLDAPELAAQRLRSLTTMASLFQHGGRPLNWLGPGQYAPLLNAAALQRMFVQGLNHRPGFLLNSWELTGLVHVPPPELIEQLNPVLPGLETLPAEPVLATGTPIGVGWYGAVQRNVCIPDDMRIKHVHVIGRPGQGKSSVLEFMILHDINQGHGVAVLDPHGRLVQRLLQLIPPEHADRVIYLDLGDPEWVPIWNPLRCAQGVHINRSRIADELVCAFKSIVDGWGDRLEHLLRHAFFALLHLPQASLLDVANLLRQKSAESKRLRTQIMNVLTDQMARQYWAEDFDHYRSADLTPPQHKLSKLLTGETVALMLSQPGSAFNFHQIMDSGQILLVNFANVGPEVLEILGCFMLSLLHISALGRNATQSHRPFHIYCDEAHRFLTEAVEDLIAETRKFDVSLTLAHQFMTQFSIAQGDALTGVESTIMFKVNTKDAGHLIKDLQEKVRVKDLVTLQVGHAIARIGNHIVRIKTQEPLNDPAEHCAEQIIAQSRQRYCKPVAEVQRILQERSGRQAPLASPPLVLGTVPESRSAEGFAYDQL